MSSSCICMKLRIAVNYKRRCSWSRFLGNKWTKLGYRFTDFTKIIKQTKHSQVIDSVVLHIICLINLQRINIIWEQETLNTDRTGPITMLFLIGQPFKFLNSTPPLRCSLNTSIFLDHTANQNSKHADKKLWATEGISAYRRRRCFI